MQSKPSSAPAAASPELAMAPLPQTVAECHTVIAQLMDRLRLLEERIRVDSSNSSKPPCSDAGRPNRVRRRGT